MRPCIVSLYPFKLDIEKNSIEPSRWIIPKGSKESPAVVPVADGKYQYYVDSDRGYQEMLLPAAQIAESVVKDFLVSCLHAGPDSHPGLFWVPEPFNPETHLEQAKKALDAQEKYFKNLIRIADSDWSRAPNPSMIGEIQKVAARYFGLKREWALEPGEDTRMCPMCSVTVKSFAVVCPQCRYVLQPKKYERMRDRVASEPQPAMA